LGKETAESREAGMRAKLVGALMVCCVAAVLAPGTALADTLDQQQPNGGSDVKVDTPDESLAQTFTAGLTGPLDRVELLLGYPDSAPNAPLTVEIRNTSGGSPGTTVLTSGSVAPSAVSANDAWVPITFGTPTPVTAGIRYAIVAYSATDSSHSYFWAIHFPDPYTAGGSFYSASPPNSTWTLAALGGDQAFKTYVEVPPTSGQPPPGNTKKCKKKRHKRAAEAKRKKCKKRKRK
jgi:hypothetical protein